MLPLLFLRKKNSKKETILSNQTRYLLFYKSFFLHTRLQIMWIQHKLNRKTLFFDITWGPINYWSNSLLCIWKSRELHLLWQWMSKHMPFHCQMDGSKFAKIWFFFKKGFFFHYIPKLSYGPTIFGSVLLRGQRRIEIREFFGFLTFSMSFKLCDFTSRNSIYINFEKRQQENSNLVDIWIKLSWKNFLDKFFVNIFSQRSSKDLFSECSVLCARQNNKNNLQFAVAESLVTKYKSNTFSLLIEI